MPINALPVWAASIVLALALSASAADTVREWSDPRDQPALEAAIKAGDPTAMRTLGWRYANGVGVDHDMEKARRCWHQAAALGDVRAIVFLAAGSVHRDWKVAPHSIDRQLLLTTRSDDVLVHLALGNAYLYGHGGNTDPFSAQSRFERAAEQGSCYAMIQLAALFRDVLEDPRGAEKWAARAIARAEENPDTLEIADIFQLGMLYSGIGVPRDDAKALAWFEKGAKTGDTMCMWGAGVTLAGIGGPKKLEAVRQWFEQAAKGGNTDAMSALAFIDMNRGNNEGSMAYLKRAAELHDRRAIYALGIAYEEGKFTKPDLALAQQLILRAADADYPPAMGAIARWHGTGIGVPQNMNLAAQWMTRAAVRGDVEAMSDLGLLYWTGKGVPQNVTAALRWWTAAAEAGDAKAMNNLGAMYLKGTAVARDLKEAVKWLRRAADQGNTLAMTTMGILYYEGDGVPKDFIEARKWFEQSAERGNADAMHNLGQIYGTGKGVKVDLAAAKKWFEAGANSGDVESMFALGMLLFNQGKGDTQAAAKWMKKAAAAGHATAKRWLELNAPGGSAGSPATGTSSPD